MGFTKSFSLIGLLLVTGVVNANPCLLYEAKYREQCTKIVMEQSNNTKNQVLLRNQALPLEKKLSQLRSEQIKVEQNLNQVYRQLDVLYRAKDELNKQEEQFLRNTI